jgi:hypothetical protein
LRAASTAAYCRPRGPHETPAPSVSRLDGARGPVLLFGMSALALPVWDQEDGAEQAIARPCRLLNGGDSRDNELTPSIVPRGTSSAQGGKLNFTSALVGSRHSPQAETASSFVQRNTVPSTHRRCMITASRRASATMALFSPRFLAIFMAQALSQDHFTLRVRMLCAPS